MPNVRDESLLRTKTDFVDENTREAGVRDSQPPAYPKTMAAWVDHSRWAMSMSEQQQPPADGDHCREMAGKLRELARYTNSPGIRRELIGLARRYDRRGDHFDRGSR